MLVYFCGQYCGTVWLVPDGQCCRLWGQHSCHSAVDYVVCGTCKYQCGRCERVCDEYHNGGLCDILYGLHHSVVDCVVDITMWWTVCLIPQCGGMYGEYHCGGLCVWNHSVVDCVVNNTVCWTMCLIPQCGGMDYVVVTLWYTVCETVWFDPQCV